MEGYVHLPVRLFVQPLPHLLPVFIELSGIIPCILTLVALVFKVKGQVTGKEILKCVLYEIFKAHATNILEFLKYPFLLDVQEISGLEILSDC